MTDILDRVGAQGEKRGVHRFRVFAPVITKETKHGQQRTNNNAQPVVTKVLFLVK